MKLSNDVSSLNHNRNSTGSNGKGPADVENQMKSVPQNASDLAIATDYTNVVRKLRRIKRRLFLQRVQQQDQQSSPAFSVKLAPTTPPTQKEEIQVGNVAAYSPTGVTEDIESILIPSW